jgi:hypothetical protein
MLVVTAVYKDERNRDDELMDLVDVAAVGSGYNLFTHERDLNFEVSTAAEAKALVSKLKACPGVTVSIWDPTKNLNKNFN